MYICTCTYEEKACFSLLSSRPHFCLSSFVQTLFPSLPHHPAAPCIASIILASLVSQSFVFLMFFVIFFQSPSYVLSLCLFSPFSNAFVYSTQLPHPHLLPLILLFLLLVLLMLPLALCPHHPLLPHLTVSAHPCQAWKSLPGSLTAAVP